MHTAMHALLHPNLFKASLFASFQKVPLSLKAFFTTSSQPNRGRPAFCLALDGWQERTFFGNFHPETRHSHLKHSLIIGKKSGIKSHFLKSLLLEIRLVRYLKQSVGNFPGKHTANLPPFFTRKRRK